MKIIFSIVTVILCLGGFFWVFFVEMSESNVKSYTKDAKVEKVNNEIDDSLNLENYEIETETHVKTWKYREEKDRMSGSTNKWASLKSDNYIYMDFPYTGETYATLFIRKNRDYGTDVIIKVDRGQIFGDSFRGNNYVRVKFDDNSDSKFVFKEAADGNPKIIFLRDRSTFIKQARKAKVVKIEVPFFQEGRRIFTFSVDSCLVW